MTTISPRPFISAVIGRPGNAARGFNQTTKERTDEMTDDINENEGGGVQTDPAAGTGAFFTKNEILDFVTANPPMGDIPPADEPLDPKAPKLVRGGPVWQAIETDTCGIRRANGTVRAWAIRENSGVEVFAKQHFVDGKPSSCWTFAGTVDCEKVIFGTIVGGRNKANQIVRFIRNGLLAARLRLRHKRMNKKARANIEREAQASKEGDAK